MPRGSLPVHGHAGAVRSRTYITWVRMRQRCRERESYAHVTVCERWMKFENFLADMGEKPEGLSIDRIDGTKGYEPGNCRWADATTQSVNRRCTKFVNFFGFAMPFRHACNLLGVNESNASRGVRLCGMSLQESLDYQIARIAEGMRVNQRREFWRNIKPS